MENLEKFIHDVFAGKVENHCKVILWQQCKTHGWVTRGSIETDKSCDDPECSSCVEWNQMLKDAGKKYDKEDFDKVS